MTSRIPIKSARHERAQDGSQPTTRPRTVEIEAEKNIHPPKPFFDHTTAAAQDYDAGMMDAIFKVDREIAALCASGKAHWYGMARYRVIAGRCGCTVQQVQRTLKGIS